MKNYSKNKITVLHAGSFISKEYREVVLSLYLEGTAIYDICDWIGLSENEVNAILNSILPYL